MESEGGAISLTALAKRLCDVAGILMFAGGAIAALFVLVDGLQRGPIDWVLIAFAVGTSLSAGPILALSAIIDLLEKIADNKAATEDTAPPAPQPAPSETASLWRRSGY